LWARSPELAISTHEKLKCTKNRIGWDFVPVCPRFHLQSLQHSLRSPSCISGGGCFAVEKVNEGIRGREESRRGKNRREETERE